MSQIKNKKSNNKISLNKNSNRNNNKIVRIKGRGDYSLSDFGKSLSRPFLHDEPSKGVINKGARWLGNEIGSKIPIPGVGRAMGNASSWLAKAFGFGDYQIKSNSLLTSNTNVAQFKNHGDITVSHREFIADITATTFFSLQNYLINPGNAALFPWLSTIAKNFEAYEMLGLIFEFKSTSATAVGSTTTGLGTLIMATDYDVLDVPFADKRSMEITDFATSAAPCYSQIHPIECSPRENVMSKLYIHSGNDVSAYPDDARFSAMGNFQIATTGVQSTSVVGELWVSYHVKLLKPQIDSGSKMAMTSIHAVINTPNAVDGGNSILEKMDTTEPGSIGVYVLSGHKVLVKCLSVAGIGSHIITMGGYSEFGGSAISYPDTNGVALYGSASWLVLSRISTGQINTRPLFYTAIPPTSGSNIGQDTLCQGAFVGVRFDNINDGVVFSLAHGVATKVFYDLYLSPYYTNFVSKSHLKTKVRTTKFLSKDEETTNDEDVNNNNNNNNNNDKILYEDQKQKSKQSNSDIITTIRSQNNAGMGGSSSGDDVLTVVELTTEELLEIKAMRNSNSNKHKTLFSIGE